MTRGFLALSLLALLPAAPALAGASLRGRVVDAVSGKPLPGAHVEVPASHVASRAAADGGFALDAVPDGPFTLVVSQPGYHVTRLDLAAPPELAVEVRLAPVVTYADRIEVTATRARTGTDPVTVTNVPEEKVAESYWGQDPAILLADVVPGFYAYNDSGNGIGYSYFTIRGFGQARSRVTVNGAPLNDAESGELFFVDLADFLATAGDIQVQRGVWGLSGIGGAVDVATRRPELEPSLTFHLGAGSFGTQRFNLVFDSGLVDGTWAVTARASKLSTDGYRDQSWVDMWNAFLSLSRYGTRSRLRLLLFGGPEETHLAYVGVPRSVLDGALTGDPDRDRRFNPLTYPGEIDTFTQPHLQLVHEVTLSPTTQLAQTIYAFAGEGSYEQYKTNRRLAEYDLPDVVFPDGSVVTHSDLVRRRSVDEWDAGWVPKLTHTTGAWEVSLGGEARLHQAHHTGEVRWAQVYPPGVAPDHRYYDYRVNKQSASLAAGATWHASDPLALSFGLQLARHRYEVHDDKLKSVAFAESYDFALPRLGLVARLGEGAHAYFNVARGMREPTFRTIYDPQDYYGERVSLDPEDVWDWEAGVSLQRETLRARANLFYMAFANEIVYAGALDDSGVPVYGNNARSLHRGLELDASAELTPTLGLDAALTISRNRFTSYDEYGWDGSLARYDGNAIAGYPDLLASVSGRASAGPLRATLTVRRVGEFYLDNSEDNRHDPAATQAPGYVPRVNPAFTVVDVALRASAPPRIADMLGAARAEVEVRLNNLLDETYTAFGYVEDGEPLFIPAAGRSLYAGVSVGF